MPIHLNRPQRINLALQGGGAHGAFTWGVLDALLADGRFAIEGVSGSSAGAMNAVVMAHGWLHGGREGARAALANFWEAVAAATPFNLGGQPDGGPGALGAASLKLGKQLIRHFTPQQINPFNINPLRKILTAQIDFERLARHSPLRLFIAATQANTGRLRLFRAPELSVDVLLASACLPTLHAAVEIDGEPYWDGGYSANPAIYPLFYDCAARDILIVMLSPLRHKALPDSAAHIQLRLAELAFNATFLREMQSFARLQSAAQASPLALSPLERRLKRTAFHLIEAEDVLGELHFSTRMVANLGLLHTLRELGRARTQRWLAAHAGQVGRRSTIDLAALFGA